MSIAINSGKCIGCKKCLNVCPGTLLSIDNAGKAFIKYPMDCWGCCSCVKECSNAAISIYLGADIGGRGSKMIVKQEEELVKWIIEEINGEIHNISINPKDSNKY